MTPQNSSAFAHWWGEFQTLQNKPSIIFINPAKNEIRLITKVILDKLDVAIKPQSKLNQWKNTKEVCWFVSIDKNPLYKFLQFDIKEFCPSVKEPPLEKAFKFAEQYINIPTNNEAIIKHAWKSLLFNKSEMWMKKRDCLTLDIWLLLTEQKYANLSAISMKPNQTIQGGFNKEQGIKYKI